MISQEFLAMVRCPENRSPLQVADTALIDQINAAIRAGRITNRAGQKIPQPIDSGLVRVDRTVLYPVFDDMPILLIDEGILLEQLIEIR